MHVPPAPTSRLAGLLTVRARLFGLALVGLVTTSAVAAVALEGQSQVRSTTAVLQNYNAVQLANRDTEVRRQALRTVLLLDLLVQSGQLPVQAAPPAAQDAAVADASERLRADVDQVALRTTGSALAGDAVRLRTRQLTYLSTVTELHAAVRRGQPPDAAALGQQQEAHAQLASDQQAFTSRVDAARTVALADRVHSQDPTRLYLLTGTVLAGLVLLLVSLHTRRFVLRAVRRLRDVASALAAGDLAARSGLTGRNEIGDLGASIDAMAESLSDLVRRLEGEAARDSFGRRLADAFDMADDEPAAHEVVRRSLHQVLPGTPAELLLADNSEAHLAVAVTVEGLEAPGCPVQSPFQCVAVRRGRPVLFADSSALDACPKLRDRPQGPLSACCTPVTFMGRALGVLHTTGPVGGQPDEAGAEQLAALAAQAGARIGTLRATRTTQLQATTDSLTGLINRRTLEERVRRLASAGGSFALVLADLDHFKQLNDRFGHEAGDRALRLFAQVLAANSRGDDLLCRYGGEEFVLVLPGQDRAAAREQLDRLRVALSGTLAAGAAPVFTASWGVTDSAESSDLQVLLRSADTALFAAKRTGRDRIVLAGEADALEPAI